MSTDNKNKQQGSTKGRAVDIVIRQAIHPITADVLSQAFRNVGELDAVNVNAPQSANGDTIITANVTFHDAAAASRALSTLQGRAIYPNACYLDLRVPDAPSSSGGASSYLAAAGGQQPAPAGGSMMHNAGGNRPMDGPQQYQGGPPRGGAGGRGVGGPPMRGAGGGRGGGGRGGYPQQQYPQQQQVMSHHMSPHAAVFHPGQGIHNGGGYHSPAPHMMGGGGGGYGGGYQGGPMGPGGMMGGGPGGPPMRGGGGGRGGGGRGGPPGVPGRGVAGGGIIMGSGHHGMYDPAGGYLMMEAGAPVLLVSNVPRNVPLIKLYLLLEVYGVVLGLRRQTKSPETVVAKFEQVSDAMVAARLLSGAPFYGKELQLRHFAGYEDRGGFTPGPNIPNDPTDPGCTTFDFTTVRHRGRPHGHGGVTGKKYPPSAHLFVANLLDTISDEEVVSVFAQKGFEVVDMARKSTSFAILSFKSVQTGIEALIEAHSTILKERYLRVTFSGFPPHSQPPKKEGEDDSNGVKQEGTA